MIRTELHIFTCETVLPAYCHEQTKAIFYMRQRMTDNRRICEKLNGDRRRFNVVALLKRVWIENAVAVFRRVDFRMAAL